MQIIPLTDEAKDALEARGIAAEAIAHLGHLVASATNDRGRQALAFRHRFEGGGGDHYGFRSLTEKKFWQQIPDGTSRVLWNNQIFDKKPKQVIITEGHIDALTLLALGFENTVSVPDGAPSGSGQDTQTKFSFLEHVDWKAIDTVILAVDTDPPGQVLRDELARRIGRSRCQYVRWSKDCKDANDVLLKHGREEVTRCISSARYIPMAGLLTLDDIPESAPEQPWLIGIEGLDDIWRWSPGRMSILTGIPGNGKTTLLADCVVSFIKKNGHAVAIASFEDDIRSSLVPRFIERIVGKPINQCTVKEEIEAEEWIQEHIVFIQPPEDDDEVIADVDWFNEHAEAAAIRRNCKVVILDPWNEVDHTTRPMDVNVTEYTGVMLKKLRQGAKRCGYHLIVAAHPKKMHKGSDGNPAMPSGYDIADSAHWMNKPDNGLTVHRGDGNRVTVNSWKCRRDGVIGTLGHRCFIYKKMEGRYEFDQVETFRPRD